VNQAEKEAYLREYSILKNEGKPFFPYAVVKDSIMAVVVMAVIIFLSLMFGAELGPKPNPSTTTYVPRPDWYFYFLFEVLRVMKNIPKFTPLATIGVPTLCMILLFLLPLYDRSPERRIERRPVALAAGATTIAAMAFLTFSGASTLSPNSAPVLAAPPGLNKAQTVSFQQGAIVVGESGCLACHTIGESGNNGPGPPLTHIGALLRPGAIADTLRNPTAPMPSFRNLPPAKFDALVGYLAELQ
jgi:menaquinol-cytochrome c reductase cytochrome b/c subunit